MKSCFLAEVADALVVALVIGLVAAPIAAETEASTSPAATSVLKTAEGRAKRAVGPGDGKRGAP